MDLSGEMVGGRQSNGYEVDRLVEYWKVEQGNRALSYRRLSQDMRLRVGSRD